MARERVSDPPFRIGVDIGGTFTDLVLLSGTGEVWTEKVASTVDDYARGIVEGLGALLTGAGVEPTEVAEIVHGTTVASNAILELNGARTGLITTRGFRDVLELRRLRFPRLYDLTWQKPPPLVERYLRVEVDERVNARGEIVRPLDPASLEAAVAYLLGERVEAVAICLLHSYANPAHEEAIAEYLRERAPHLHVSVSSRVLPEIREYERTSTTVVNAYVAPIVRGYLDHLSADLAARGVAAPLLVMQSNGGVMGARSAAARPIHVIESGPAAGVVAAAALARDLDLPRMITLDMGGTTAKAGIVEDGAVYRAPEYEVGGGIISGARLLKGAGHLLRAPVIDLAEVGAGGGSLLWIDPAGAPRVGPRSAGAVPGPACYDQGGIEPTITDANLVLGYVNPDHLAGGAVRLNPDRAYQSLRERIARPLGLSLEEAAFGAHTLAAATMTRAIKAVSSERGRDPRDYVLCTFGGNGPIFAATLAGLLEIERVVIPPSPGLFSAFGLLFGEVEHHLGRTLTCRLDEVAPADLAAGYGRLEAEAWEQLAAEGYSPERVGLRRAADLHYPGQSFELTVDLPDGDLGAGEIADLADRFGAAHERTYGHRAGPDAAVEIVGLRLVARGIPERPHRPPRLRYPSDAPIRQSSRRVYFGPRFGWRDTPIVGRGDVDAVARAGPLIVEEADSSTVVPPGAGIRRDERNNLVLELSGG